LRQVPGPLPAVPRDVDGTWDDDVLTVPKIILLAEDFTAQTYTTVTWLSNLTPNLSIEMHTVNAFVLEGQRPCIVFRRLFPAVDPSTRVLTPGVAVTGAASVATKIAEKKRRIRSTYTLHDKGVIPVAGTSLHVTRVHRLLIQCARPAEMCYRYLPGGQVA
jgi:hypothetical protein